MTSGLVFSPGICLPVVSPIEDGTNRISNISRSTWNLSIIKSTSRAASWNITQQQITSTIAISWLTQLRIHAINNFFVPGISVPIVHPIDQNYLIPGLTWDVDYRGAGTHKIAWRVNNRISAKHSASWNVRILRTVALKTSFMNLNRVSKPVASLEEFIGLDQPIVHPISYHAYTPSPSSSWQLSQRLNLSKSIHWKYLAGVKSVKTIAFNTKDVHVSPQIASSWTLRKSITASVRCTWQIISRRPTSRSSIFSTNTRTNSLKQIRFKNLGFVTKQSRSTWILVKTFNIKVKSQWTLRDRISAQSATSWNIRTRVVCRPWGHVSNASGAIGTPVVHPIDIWTPASVPVPYKGLCSPVVSVIDGNNYGGFGTQPVPQISWRLGINPAGRVSAQVQIRWFVYIIRSPAQRVTWTTIGRQSHGITTAKFNLLKAVSKADIIEWNVGQSIEGQIRQTSAPRTDFAY